MRALQALAGLKRMSGAAILVWPFAICFGLRYDSLRWILPIMILLLVLRLSQTRQKTGPMRPVLQSMALAGIALCIASWLLKTHQLLLFYPVAVNGVMLALFGSSLWSAMPLVERIARWRDPALSPTGVRYTRRVTQIWCLFFIGNGAMALFTALHGDITLWTAWNGVIAYLLMGALMGGEWLVRRRVMERDR